MPPTARSTVFCALNFEPILLKNIESDILNVRFPAGFLTYSFQDTDAGGVMSRPTDEDANAKAEAALQLRIQGMTYRAINQVLGFTSSSAAHKAVTKLLQNSPPEPAEELRTLEAERLDDLRS